MDDVFMSAFFETDALDRMSATEFFQSWCQKNAKNFTDIKKEQKTLYQCITDFDNMNIRGLKMLEPIDFSKPNYDTETTKNALAALKDQFGIQTDELNFAEPVNGRASSLEMFYIISSHIEFVIEVMAQNPVREIEEIQDDAVVVNDLYTKTMKVYNEVLSLKKLFAERRNLSYASPQNILRDNGLLNVYISTPPISLTIKESECTSPFELPFQRPGEPIRFHLSQSILQMSQRQLQLTPKPKRNISMNALNDLRPPPAKRQPLINSTALFGLMSKPSNLKNTSVCSRLDSYSIVMPGSANVLSSTVLESTRRSLTPLNDFESKASSGSDTLKAMKSVSQYFSRESPDFNKSRTPNVQKQNTPSSQTSKRVSIISRGSFMANSPEIKIKINDQSCLASSPTIPVGSIIEDSHSPTGRVLKPIKRSILENGTSYSNINPRNLSLKLEEEMKEKDDSPGTSDLLQKFNKINLCDKENLFDTSDPGFLNDSF